MRNKSESAFQKIAYDMDLKYRILNAFRTPSTINQVRNKLEGKVGLRRISPQVYQLFANAFILPENIHVQRLRKERKLEDTDDDGVYFLIRPDQISGRKNVPPSQRKEIFSYLIADKGEQYIKCYEELQRIYSSIEPTKELLAREKAANEEYHRRPYDFV